MARCKLVVEDSVGQAILRRLLKEFRSDLYPPLVDGLEGNQFIRKNLPAFIAASRSLPHLVLVDLDDLSCAPELLARWQTKNSGSGFCLRVAVREGEAWLLSDREAFATYFQVGVAKVPRLPETLSDPKASVLALTRSSRTRAIREDMTPTGTASKGPGYNTRLVEFVEQHWSPHRASVNAPSLQRAIDRIKTL